MPATRATEQERSLLTAACSPGKRDRADRIRSVLRHPIRWDFVAGLAENHGVQPLLYAALKDVRDLVPDGAFQSLAQKYQTNIHKSLMLSRELIRIVDRLTSGGIDVMPYKGPALAEAVYGDIALRQSGDIDLFIHAPDLARVREAVKELGYVPNAPWPEAQEAAYLQSGYECAFDGAAGRNLLEVQWAIQPRFYAVDFDVDQIFRRAVTISVAGREMRTPNLEDLFIVLSLHAAKHVWGRLIWLCDLARIIGLKNLNWAEIGSMAARLGVVRILRVTLELAHRILAAPVPDAVRAFLPEDRNAVDLASEFEPHILREEVFDSESVAYFRLMLRLRERRTDQARFLGRLILTPGPGEWAAVRLPRSLFPFYRIVRIGRLAARFVRV